MGEEDKLGFFLSIPNQLEKASEVRGGLVSGEVDQLKRFNKLKYYNQALLILMCI